MEKIQLPFDSHQIRIGFATGFAKRESRGRKDSRSKQIPRIRESRFAGFANHANPGIRGIRKIGDFANPTNPRIRRIRESHANASPWIRALRTHGFATRFGLAKKIRTANPDSRIRESKIRKDSPIWTRLESHEIRTANHRNRTSMIIFIRSFF